MNKNICLILTTTATSVLGFTALAEDSAVPKNDRPGYSNNRLPDGRRMNRLHEAAKASELIGMSVNNYQDEKLGKVEDLAVDIESGRIVQVILSTGGFIGIGDRLSAVPPGALHYDPVKKVVHLNADKEKLKSAPAFETSKWAEQSSSEHVSEVYRYYGEESSFRFISKDGSTVDAQDHVRDQANPTSTGRRDGIRSGDRWAGENRFMIPTSRLSQLQKASKLIGMGVQNLHDEKLGKVENLVIDLPSGRVVAVVVSSGGFLGMGDELSALPPSALRFATDRNTLQVDTTKELLSQAPHFRAHEWPDFAEPTYTAGVYKAYDVRPYFKEGMNKDVDNTARNVRDRDERALTPLDQGSSEADRNTTAEIRKAIIAEKGFSINARNVKIITVNGQVTLRGPVKTPEERTRIEEIANRIASAASVNSQLEVKFRAETSENK